jgi:O-antigen ligase
MAAGTLVIAVPLITQDSDAYSDRGVVWAWAFAQFDSASQYMWGVSSVWPGVPTLRGSIGAPAFSAHNLFVQWLFVGGVALTLLGAALFIAYIRRAVSLLPGSYSLVATMYILILLITSMTEYIFVLTPGSPFLLVTVVPLICVLAQPREVRHTRGRNRQHARDFVNALGELNRRADE